MKKSKELMASCISLICTFLVLVAVCYGWYSMNKNVGTGGMEITVIDHTMDLHYAIYKYDDELAEGVDVTGEEDALILRAYDSIILSKNEYTPIIIKLVLSGEIETTNLTCRIACSELNMEAQVLSNIISINLGHINIDSVAADEIYLAACEYFAENKNKVKTFINNGSKELIIDFDLSIYADYLEDNSLTFYLEIDYSKELIADKEFFVNGDNFDINITYDSDLDKITVFGGSN